MLAFSATLANSLNAATDKVNWASILCSTMGTTVRLRAWRDADPAAVDPVATGTEFLNVALTGALTYNPNTGDVTLNNALSGVTVKQAADLSTGSAVLRLEGSSNTITGTLGLTGSGKDFTFPANPLGTANGVAFGANVTLGAPLTLPTSPGDSVLLNVGDVIAPMSFENYTASAITNVPVTFGQAFKRGAMFPTNAAVGLKFGSTITPAQIDVKATHNDGSIRHAVISAVLPQLVQNTTTTYQLVRQTYVAPTPPTVTEFSALSGAVSLNIGGTVYSAQVSDVFTGSPTKWLSGDVCAEWILVAPLKTAGGTVHPQLHARFYVRGYKGQAKAKVDVIVENTWIKLASSPVSGQQGFVDNGITSITADVTITIGGTQVFSEVGTVHYPYTRWKRTFWWNTAQPPVVLKHNLPYLTATKIVPNYALDTGVDTTYITNSLNAYNSKKKLMDSGLMQPYMGTTGGREDIGLLPAWDVRAMLCQTRDAFISSLGTSDQSGAFGAHFRNYTTGKPLTIAEAPYFGLLIGSPTDVRDPATGIYWTPPATGGAANPNVFETAHTPDVHYIPYLLTGDFYYLEGLKFWTNTTIYARNAGYRGPKALVKDGQIRAQAWNMRHIVHCAYITPDADTDKNFYLTAVQDNIDWYKTNWVDNAPAFFSSLGYYVINKDSPDYLDSQCSIDTAAQVNERRGIAMWQDDFLTMVWGRMLELGFSNAKPFFDLKSKFVVQRLISGTAFCYQFASKYAQIVRAPTSSGGAFYTTMAQLYQNGVKTALRGLQCGSQAMIDAIKADIGSTETLLPGTLIPDGGNNAQGGANIMQPALAYACTFGEPNSADAWLVYTSAPSYRPVDIKAQAQFTINPRVTIPTGNGGGGGGGTTPPPPPPVTTTTISYTTNTADVLNPERGFYVHILHGGDFSNGNLGIYKAQNISLVLYQPYLTAFKTSAISGAFLTQLQANLNQIRSNGMKTILRFAYDSTNTTDATLAQIQAHLDQLAPYLSANSDIIMGMQCGFVGQWGEFQGSTNFGTDSWPPSLSTANKNARKAVVDKCLAVMPSNRFVAVRQPWIKMYNTGNTPVNSTTKFNGSAQARCGHFNDCFLSGSTDAGTYTTDPTGEANFLAADTNYVPMGGETCTFNEPRSSGATAVTEMARFHWSYCNVGFEQNVITSWKNSGHYATISKSLGYRLRLISATLPTTATAGGTMTVNISIINEGYAAPIAARPVKLVMRNKNTNAVTTIDFTVEVRDWLAGSTNTLNQALNVPSGLAAGQYDLLLWLPDPAAGLANLSAFAIQLMNTGVWESATGYNKLNHTVTVS